MPIQLSKTPLPDFNATVTVGRDSVVMTPQELVATSNDLLALAQELIRDRREATENARLLAQIQKAERDGK